MEKRVSCPACNFVFSVAADLGGMTVECPNCGVPFEIPQETGKRAAREVSPRQAQPPTLRAEESKEHPPEKTAPVKGHAAGPKAPTGIPDVWDLPAGSAPDPRAALEDAKKRRLRVVTAVVIVALVMTVSLILAARFKRPGMRFEPPPDTVPMNQDVELGHWRFRVTGAAWRRLPGETPDAVGPQVLDVGLSVTNLDNSPRAMPPVKLGSRWGKDLGAELGTPVLRTDDGCAVPVLRPDQTVQGHVVFQPQFDEYCLIVSGDDGTRANVTSRIRLTPETVQPPQ